MTEELSHLLSLLTCPRCNGGGILAWRCDTQQGGTVARHHSTLPCDLCGGDGINATDVRFTPIV